MKRPICENHKLEIKMHRKYVRINQRWTGIGWICLKCGKETTDNEIIVDKNQKSILSIFDFKKEKVDK